MKKSVGDVGDESDDSETSNIDFLFQNVNKLNIIATDNCPNLLLAFFKDEVNSEAVPTLKMKLLAKIFNRIKSLNIFAKGSIVDVCQDFDYTSEYVHTKNEQMFLIFSAKMKAEHSDTNHLMKSQDKNKSINILLPEITAF